MDFRAHVRAQLPNLRLRREPEIVNEIAEHLEELYDEARREGLTHEGALARAHSALPQLAAAFARDLRLSAEPLGAIAGHSRILHDLSNDIRYGLRRFGQAPGFALAVVFTLALGLGATSVIYSVIEAVLLRPPAVTAPEALVHVYSATADGRSTFSTSSYPNYVDLRDAAGFSGLVAYASIALALNIDDTTHGVSGQVVTGNYFDVLGVRLPYGRSFAAEEDRPGSPAYVVVLSDRAWRQYFAADPALVGRRVSLNGMPYTVVGIAPPGFSGPVLGQAPEMWVPMALQADVRPPSAGLRRSLGGSNLLPARGIGWLNLIGRLPTGITIDTMRSTVDVVARRLEAADPGANSGRRFTMVALGEGPGVRTAARPLIRALAAAVGMVLLIACANVASLLVVRALSVRREVAVRLALGASRSRLIRQWLTECVLLALAGAAGALLITWWAAPLLYAFGIPESAGLSVNASVALFTLAVAVACGVFFGLMSVAQLVGDRAGTALRDESRSATAGPQATRLRSAFVVVQVALSLVLLAGAGLFMRTLQNAYGVNLGYQVDRTLLAEINLDVRGYAPDAGQLAYARILDRIRSIPGVTAAGAARVLVLGGSERIAGVSTDGGPVQNDGSNSTQVRTNVVSTGYLEALGIPLLRGRDFAASDAVGAERVAIVSRSLAERLWPDVDPIGKPLVTGNGPLQVIAVVPDVVYSTPIEADPRPFYFSTLAQNYESAITLHVRTVGEPLDLFPAVRRAVAEVDASLVVSRPVALRQVLDTALGDQRLLARVVTVFGGIALTLAVVGLYGVLAHVVAQRRAEIGVRMALGANPGSILHLILRQGARLVAIGLILGIIAAVVAGRYIETQLFGVTPTDPLTLVTVCALFAVVATCACVIPARRAMHVDPTVAMK